MVSLSAGHYLHDADIIVFDVVHMLISENLSDDRYFKHYTKLLVVTVKGK